MGSNAKYATRTLRRNGAKRVHFSKKDVAKFRKYLEDATEESFKHSFWAKTIAWEKSKNIVLD